MTQEQQARHVGVVGMAVMGANLARNLARNGFAPAVYNRTASVTDELLAGDAKGAGLLATYSPAELVASLERPRRILLMVKAGPAVDAVIEELAPYLEEGDILIDGGNSFFQDTERRSKDLANRGFNFVGMGVSGGEEGALWGPSLMPGGPVEAYAELEPMLTAIAAESEYGYGRCVTHIGPGASGHYVKMVHNGIEYGDMELIAESYAIMREALGMSAPEIGEVFRRWNRGKLESYLIEITADVLAYQDVDTGQPLVDLILDEAEQKGTGRWTSQNSFELGTPTPVINAAVIARGLSSMKSQRLEASKVLTGPGGNGKLPAADRDTLIDALENALYFSKISSYAQGMALLQAASEHYGWSLDLSEIARIWTGGCIIRARLLKPIMDAYSDGRQPTNLMLDPYFTREVNAGQDDIRMVLRTTLDAGIPTPAMSWALNYYDTYRTASLPANLIQGLRDLFGAHTYKRVDKDGTFHTEWVTEETRPAVKSEPSDRQAWADGEGEGDRADVAADLPEGASAKALHPDTHEDVAADAEEKGERTPASTRKAEY